jgi:hypothetical protein
MIIEELVAVLAFEIDDKPLRAFNDGFENLLGSVAKIGAIGAAAGASVFALAQRAANAGDEIANTSQKFGIATGALQELMFAARGEADALQNSMAILSRNIESAGEAGSPTAKTFSKLGVATRDLGGNIIPTDQILMKLSDSFQQMPDGAAKTAAAMEIFGKQGAKLIPFLNQGSSAIGKLREEAVALGVVLSEDDIAAAEGFNDAIDDLMNTLKGLGNFVGAKLFPLITGLASRFKEMVKVNRQVIATRLERFFQFLATTAEKAFSILDALLTSAEGLASVFGGLENIVRAAATAFLLLTAGQVLFSLGKMVALVADLGKMLTIANAKALLIPILIGAAVVALGLIIEDIIAFFQGRDSVTGIIVEKFKEMFAFLSEGFKGLGDMAKIALAVILTPLRGIIGSFQSLLDIINVVRGKLNFKDALGTIGSRVLNTFGMGATDSLSGALGIAETGSPSQAAAALPRPFEIAPNQNMSNMENNIQMPITVQVGQNASPFEVGREVQKQAGGSLQEILRGAQRSYAGQGSY